jgi:uncharacterized peroxidase-related enzyme
MKGFSLYEDHAVPLGSGAALETARQQFGFVPNLLRVLAGAPAAVNAYVTLHGLLETTSFNPIERQLILAATSVANRCAYCVAAHTVGLKLAGLGSEQIEAVRGGRSLANPRLEALRRFTTAVVDKRGWIDEAEVDEFLRAGYRRDQVFEVLVGVAMKTLSNYANHIADTPLDRALEPFTWESAPA